MNESIVKSFVGSAVKVLGQELGGSIGIGKPSAQGDHYVTQGVTALIGVTGRLRGILILGLSQQTALKVVSIMMGQPYEELDAVAQSGIAELGNVVAGSACTLLAEIGYSCGITPPAVILGSDSVISTPNTQRLVIPLIAPTGTIEMQLALRDNGTH